MSLLEPVEERCGECWFLGLNHDPRRHCLRMLVRAVYTCNYFEEIEELPVYTLGQLGFRPETTINRILEREQ